MSKSPAYYDSKLKHTPQLFKLYSYSLIFGIKVIFWSIVNMWSFNSD